MVSVLNTGVKVDENRFRKKSADTIADIMRQVLEKEKALGITISLSP